MRHPFFLPVTVMVSVISALSVPAFCYSDQFVPQGIETFDGKSWSGLSIGITTQETVKKQFRNGKGEYPTSVALSLDRNSKIRVDALFPGKEKDAVLEGICVRFKDDKEGYDLAECRRAMGDGAVEHYVAGRLEDWRLIAYPAKGVLLFALDAHVPLVLMGSPERIARLADSFPASVTPIEKRADPDADKPRGIEFGNISVDYDLHGIGVKDQPKEERGYRQVIEQATAGGTMRFRQGASGSYSLVIRADYDAKRGGTGSVTATIDGDSPYGPVRGEGRGTFDIPAAKNGGASDATNWSYSAAAYEAMRKAERGVRDDIKAQGPPPIEVVRQRQWLQIVGAYRAASAVAAGENATGSAASSPPPTDNGTKPTTQLRNPEVIAKMMLDKITGIVDLDGSQKTAAQAILLTLLTRTNDISRNTRLSPNEKQRQSEETIREAAAKLTEVMGPDKYARLVSVHGGGLAMSCSSIADHVAWWVDYLKLTPDQATKFQSMLTEWYSDVPVGPVEPTNAQGKHTVYSKMLTWRKDRINTFNKILNRDQQKRFHVVVDPDGLGVFPFVMSLGIFETPKN